MSKLNTNQKQMLAAATKHARRMQSQADSIKHWKTRGLMDFIKALTNGYKDLLRPWKPDTMRAGMQSNAYHHGWMKTYHLWKNGKLNAPAGA